MTFKIKESQIIYTRNCNNECSYCGLIHGRLEEATEKQWKQVVDNIFTLGIKFVKISGGEPMTKPREVINLIRYIKNMTDIKVTLVSNSKWDDKYLGSLCLSGIDTYATTLNTFTQHDAIDISDFLRSQEAYKKLLKIRNRLGKVYVDLVVSSKNLENLITTIDTLSEENIPSYVFPIICGECNTPYQARVENTKFKLKKEDKAKVGGIMEKLIEMKKKGLPILNNEEYLGGMAKYGLEGGTWKCSNPTELRIDSDGAIMLCNDIRGEISEKLNLVRGIIKDPSKWWSKYNFLWKSTREKINCKCYWPCYLNSTN